MSAATLSIENTKRSIKHIGINKRVLTDKKLCVLCF